MSRTWPLMSWWGRRGRADLTQRGTRVLLSPLTENDAADFFDSIDDEVVRWQGWDDALLQRFHVAYPRMVADRFRGRPTHLAVRAIDSGAFLGMYTFSQDHTDSLADTLFLGWWLGPGVRERGVGKESLKLALDYAHHEMLVGQVRMGTAADNVRALAQIRSTGANEVAHAPIVLANGTTVPGVWFLHEL